MTVQQVKAIKDATQRLHKLLGGRCVADDEEFEAHVLHLIADLYEIYNQIDADYVRQEFEELNPPRLKTVAKRYVKDVRKRIKAAKEIR